MFREDTPFDWCFCFRGSCRAFSLRIGLFRGSSGQQQVGLMQVKIQLDSGWLTGVYSYMRLFFISTTMDRGWFISTTVDMMVVLYKALWKGSLSIARISMNKPVFMTRLAGRISIPLRIRSKKWSSGAMPKVPKHVLTINQTDKKHTHTHTQTRILFYPPWN